MKRLIALAAISAIAGGASLALPTSNAVADPPGAVQYCKFLSQNGIIPNQGQCVSEINRDMNSFCQSYAQYFNASVGACIHFLRQG